MSLLKRRIVSRGFTIVELLIVIVIIGILSTLVFVSYTGISDLARKSAMSTNAQSVLRSLKVYLVDNETFDPLSLDETNIKSTLNIDANGYDTLAMYNQAGENYIYIVGKDNFSDLIACGIQGSVTVYRADEAACAFGGSAYAVDPVLGDTPRVFGGGNGSTCALAKTIGSIEDLVYLATTTNSGTTYSGICLKLTTDLDFEQSRSYVDKNDTYFGDLNGNGTTEGLKTELTTGAGFVPIGNSAAKFSGTLTGDLHTIYNLMINRPATDYIGLIGYQNGGGKVTALNLVDLSVVGLSYTAGLAGYIHSSGSATENSVQGTVAGTSYVGLLVGRSYSMSTINLYSNIAEGDVTGVNYVGGVVGNIYNWAGSNTYFGAVYRGGSVTATGSSYSRVIGSTGSYIGAPNPVISSFAISSVTVNGSAVSSSSTDSIQGSSVASYDQILNDINLAENALDTYIGGDNDSNGFYWDYDETNKVVRKRASDSPITFSLGGSGTVGSPYIINNSNDLRQASTKQNVYYKLASDIDLAGEHFYMLGSLLNKMTGNFNGDMHTINSIDINAIGGSYLGFVGYLNSSGIVTSLNLTDISISGANYISGVAGYMNNSQANELYIQGNITGISYVGMLAGNTYSSSLVNISGNIIEGNVTGVNYVGGAVGKAYDYAGANTLIAAIYKEGAIIATGSNFARITGYVSQYTAAPVPTMSSLAVNSVTVNGSPINSSETNNLQGSTIASYAQVFDDINLAEVALDTYIGGDNSANGYYWDYDGSNNVVMKNTTANPITFALSGAGTLVSPYIINNASDLRQASTKQNVYYKLASDINMSGQNFYMLGSFNNKMTGSFNGGAYTISNITINAPGGNFIGFVGYLSSSSAKIFGLNLTNLSVTGANYTGGAVGYMVNSQVTDMYVQGNIVGSSHVGILAGRIVSTSSSSPGKIASTVTEGNVTGVDSVAGGVGSSRTDQPDSAISLAILYKSGSITASAGNHNRIVGVVGSYVVLNTTISSNALSSITINGSPVTSSLTTSVHGKDIVAGDLSVDTTYTNIGFNFTDEALDYIWYIDGATATFREGNL